MQRSIILNNGLQDLLDLSEHIIGNHISILDPSFKLLAYSKRIECNDPVVTDLIMRGHHTEETIKKFKLASRFKVWEKSDSVVINKSCDVSNCTTVGKAFKFKNTYSIQVIMLCVHIPLSEGLIDLSQK